MITMQDRQYLQKKKIEIVDNCTKCHGRSPYCDCAKELSLEIAKIKANIPEIVRDFTLAQLTHPQLQKQKVKLEEYLKEVMCGTAQDLLITGTSGTAKTSAAVSFLVQALRQKQSGYYFSSLRVVKDALTSLWDKGVPADPLINTIKTADFIVIDNLNAISNLPDFMRELLLDVFRTRALYGKRTVLVADCIYAELPEAYKHITSYLNFNKIELIGFNYKEKVIQSARRLKNGK